MYRHARLLRAARRASSRLMMSAGLALGLAAMALPARAQLGAELGAPPAGAASGDPWRVTVGAGAGVGPAYEGSSKFRVRPLPILDVVYRDRFFLSTVGGLGANILAGEGYRLGVSVNWVPGRDQDLDGRLRGLGDIDPGAQLRLFGSYAIGPVALSGAVRHEVGATDGTLFDAAIAYRWRPTERWSMSAGPSLTIADDTYTRAYFGVTAAQARRAALLGNPLRSYRPDGGVKDVGFAVSSVYRLTDHWALGGRLGFIHLLGDAADSPIVKRELEPTGNLYLSYRF